jgi:hypothetical protein
MSLILLREMRITKKCVRLPSRQPPPHPLEIGS